MRDCEALTPSAQKIFETLKPHFPPNPWGRPQWQKEGIVIDNWTYDLRKAADRTRLIDWTIRLIGPAVELEARMLEKEKGSIDTLTEHKFNDHIRHLAKLLLILRELDFQIETQDIVDECQLPTAT